MTTAMPATPFAGPAPAQRLERAAAAQRSHGFTAEILDDAAAARTRCTAQATSDFFSDITGRFDVTQIDLVALGGAVPPDRKAELKEQIGAINPRVTEASLRQVEAIFATALRSAPDGPTAAQPGEEGR